MSHYTPTGRRFKVFVKESHCSDPYGTPAQLGKLLPITPLTGDKAKLFYEEILNQPSSSAPETQKPQPKPLLPPSKPPPLKKFKNTDLLRMAQDNDVNSLNSFFFQQPDCDVNIVDDFGWTPLLCASCSGAEEAVRILLEKGADPNKCDKLGNTPLKLAKQKGWQGIRDMLENWGLKKSETEEREAEDPCEPFFCPICKGTFLSRDRHECSTLHLFNCPMKTQTFYGIPETNKGFQLLLREGWEKEKGLGRDGRGRKFPVKASMKKGRAGIGAPELPDKSRSDGHHNEKYENKKRRLYKRRRDKNFEKNFRLEFS